MTDDRCGPLQFDYEVETWPLVTAFRISGHLWECAEVVRVRLRWNEHIGQGEAAGVYYRNDTVASMMDALRSVRAAIEAGVSRRSLYELLPAGGARNALDCALWDLQSKVSGQSVWRLAGLEQPQPLITTLACGADSPDMMARVASGYTHAKAIKLKLTGEPIDAERVRAVREVRPNVWLGVDGNQGFTRGFLESLMPVLVAERVDLIEQPFPVGEESLLDVFRTPIPIAADESVQSLADLEAHAGRFAVVNIKLDKCGGLTAGLEMARAARSLGFDVMVGCMMGTSLSMAPAFLLGQLCKVVDLDAPTFLRSDRATPVTYHDGYIQCPTSLWGYP